MSVVIDKDKLKRIVQGSYQEIKKYERKQITTKQTVVSNIVTMIEREIKK